MTFNRRVIAGKSEVIARVLDLPEHGFDGVMAWVMKLREELGVPHSLAEIGVHADNAAVIGSEAAIDPSAGGNPIPVSAAHLEQIFRAAVAGDLAAISAG
jgi:alcohol dehydrogenase class IV